MASPLPEPTAREEMAKVNRIAQGGNTPSPCREPAPRRKVGGRTAQHERTGREYGFAASGAHRSGGER